MQTCNGKTKTGADCRAPAGSGGLCFFHEDSDRARALGQIGGRRNRRSAVLELEIPNDMTAADVRNLTAQAIRLLLSGDLKAREATALSRLCDSLYRGIPAADLEVRVKALEAQLTPEEHHDPLEQDATDPDSNRCGAVAETDSELPVEPASENEAEGTSNAAGEAEET